MTLDDNHGPFPVEILGEDGLPWLKHFQGTIDLLYLDADGPGSSAKSIYHDLLQAALHALRSGSIVLAHNSVNAAYTMTDYLKLVRNPARFASSVNVIVDDQGLEVSCR
jgi:predicted O-methyltransferase YrrM